MIGIGITTTPKRKALHYFCISQIEKHTPEKHLLFVYEDTEGRGVAYSKNQCLRNLSSCDHIILLDDDCFPIANGWVDHFTKHNIPHLLYLDRWGSIKKIGEQDELDFYNNCGGCLMYMTKEVIEKVGAFNENFGRYGFEHAEYSIRCYQAGLSPSNFTTPKHSKSFVHSLDYDGPHGCYEATPNLTIQEVQQCKQKAQMHFSNTPTIYRPL